MRRSSKRSSSARRLYKTTTITTLAVIRILIAVMEVVEVTTITVMMMTMMMITVGRRRTWPIWRETLTTSMARKFYRNQRRPRSKSKTRSTFRRLKTRNSSWR